MAKFKLVDFQEKSNAKYQPAEIELPDGNIVTLVPVMKMKKEQRKRLDKVQSDRAESDKARKEAEDEGVDRDELLTYMQAFITAVADTEVKGKALVDVVGDDLATMIEIVNDYSESTQPGEASNSES